MGYASANFRYVREGQLIAALAAQRLGDSSLYNERELKHMQAVQSDTLIRLFPEKFWFDAALTISNLSLLGGLVLAWIGRALQSQQKAVVIGTHPSVSQP